MSNEYEFNLSSISSFWYRKSYLPLFKDLEIVLDESYSSFKSEYTDYLINDELKSIEEFLIKLLESKNHLGNYYAKNGNKLIYFLEAKNAGLQIPEFLISNSLSQLKESLAIEKKMIKPIQDLFYLVKDDVLLKNYYSDNLESLLSDKK